MMKQIFKLICLSTVIAIMILALVFAFLRGDEETFRGVIFGELGFIAIVVFAVGIWKALSLDNYWD